MDKDGSGTGRRTRRAAGVGAAVVAVGIFALSSIPAAGYPSHPGFLNVIAHFLEYLTLAALLTTALSGPRLRLWQAALLAVALASLYGASDELHQLFVPGRVSDPMDWLTDTLGAFIGAAAAAWTASARMVRRSRERDKGI